jgi:hypothetical protein
MGALLFGLVLTACSRQPKPQIQIEKTRPLPEVPAGDQHFSSFTPKNAFSEMAPMVLSRTVYQGPGPRGYRVEVRDLRVAAHRKAENLTLPGAAFAEVRYGAGVLTVGDKRQDLVSGTTSSVSQGQHFSLESTSDQPLIVRVHLLAAE